MRVETRPIPGFPGYSISADGVVYSQRRIGCGGGVDPSVRPRTMALFKSGRGYRGVKLRAGPGEKVTVAVHRLVLLAWVGPPPHGKPWACHRDGNPANNKLSNLRWATPRENARDALDHGTHPNLSKAKLTPETREQIRREYASGMFSQKQLAAAYGVSQMTISFASRGIKNGRGGTR